jgi:hypothetical protein
MIRSRVNSYVQRGIDAWAVLTGRAKATREPGYFYSFGNTQFPTAIAGDGLPCFRSGTWTMRAGPFTTQEGRP